MSDQSLVTALRYESLERLRGNVATVLADARSALRCYADGHNDEADLDAEVLLRETLGCTRAWLIAHGNDPVAEGVLTLFRERLRQRASGQPIAYIIGQREFWSLTLQVTADVLIPRADTELLVQCALDLLPAEAAATVGDLGTGSGAVALAIASERPLACVIGTDSSPAALQLAQRNAQHLQTTLAAPTPRFVAAHWFDALASDCFDLIVSNPPYIRSNDPHLALGDLRFEPSRALVAGEDGLDDLRVIIEQAPRCLRAGGNIALEHGYDQGDAVRNLLTINGFEKVRTHADLGGHERVSQGYLTQ